MTVENAKAPGRGHKQAGAGEKDTHQRNGQFALLSLETGSDSVNEPGCCENAQKNQQASGKRKQSGHGAGSFPGFFLVAAGEQVCVDGDKRGGQYALAKKILQEIRDAKRRFEDVGGIGVAEVVGEDSVADESSDAA